MHDPAAGAAAGIGHQFVPRYGMIFVWHAASAALAWCVLAPLGFAWMRATRRAGGSDVFRGHRVVMLSVVALTVQAWLLAVVYEHNTPSAHAVLGSIVLLLSLLQVSIGAMRPSIDAGTSRSFWTAGHRAVAFTVFCVAAYTCHHSIYVFEISTLPASVIHGCLAITVLAMIAAEVAPPSMCKRITGRRAGYFEDGAEHHLQKVQDDPLGSGVGFRVVEDDAYEIAGDEEESALSLMPDEGNTNITAATTTTTT